jgi:hypothetical protein
MNHKPKYNWIVNRFFRIKMLELYSFPQLTYVIVFYKSIKNKKNNLLF